MRVARLPISSLAGYWFSWYITPNNMDDPDAYRCNFDVSDVVLAAPGSGVTVTLPHTFSWNRRGTASDDYEFNLADMGDHDPEWWTSVGYVDSYTLAGLPSGFTPGTKYVWWVNVYGPHGFGAPYYGHYVTFTKAGVALQGQAVPAPRLVAEDD